MAIIKPNNNTLSSITALPTGVGGKVLQVVTANTNSAVANESTSYVDTGLTASITPSSTSNKILILINQSIGKSNANVFQDLNLLRNGSQIVQWGNDVLYTATVQHLYTFASLNYLDTPSSTSSLVFKTQFKSNTTTQVNAQPAGSYSSITLMEIAG
jgi:hypothetical protein